MQHTSRNANCSSVQHLIRITLCLIRKHCLLLTCRLISKGFLHTLRYWQTRSVEHLMFYILPPDLAFSTIPPPCFLPQLISFHLSICTQSVSLMMSPNSFILAVFYNRRGTVILLDLAWFATLSTCIHTTNGNLFFKESLWVFAAGWWHPSAQRLPFICDVWCFVALMTYWCWQLMSIVTNISLSDMLHELWPI